MSIEKKQKKNIFEL